MKTIRYRWSKAIFLWVYFGLYLTIEAITTTHYDKAPAVEQYPDNKVEKINEKVANLTIAERQKRLMPYINFYLQQQVSQPQHHRHYLRYQPSTARIPYVHVQPKYSELIATAYHTEGQLQPHQSKFTPFLESNALPGAFTPMVKPQQQNTKVTYIPVELNEKVPNYSVIYDQLSQLKLQHALQAQLTQSSRNHRYGVKRPPPSIVQEHNQIRFTQAPPPSETYLHTFTPTNIEVTEENYEPQDQVEININPAPAEQQPPPQVLKLTQINSPKPITVIEEPVRFIPVLQKNPVHYIVHEQKQYHNQNHKQYLQEVVPNKPPIFLIAQKGVPQFQYAQPQKPIKASKPIIVLQQSKPINVEPVITQAYEPLPPVRVMPSQISTPIPEAPTENPNSLGLILKRLQDTNALPHTLTPDNIDNSIKTLVHILNSLKKQQFTTTPIVVPDEETSYEEDNEAGVDLGESHGEEVPGTVVETFPANTPEGGTPGKPGVDYPALATIPQTNFNCKTQRYKGFFADPDTNCQVWHYCDLNGGQASFLCPNGTIFSQVALTCDWWFNVKCSTTTQLYVLNERLYKYIIPLTPKFPEDYSGPLVDRYLAQKFKEMEEKMKSQKKDKQPTGDKSEEIDELQLLEEKNAEYARSTESSTEQRS